MEQYEQIAVRGARLYRDGKGEKHHTDRIAYIHGGIALSPQKQKRRNRRERALTSAQVMAQVMPVHARSRAFEPPKIQTGNVTRQAEILSVHPRRSTIPRRAHGERRSYSADGDGGDRGGLGLARLGRSRIIPRPALRAPDVGVEGGVEAAGRRGATNARGGAVPYGVERRYSPKFERSSAGTLVMFRPGPEAAKPRLFGSASRAQAEPTCGPEPAFGSAWHSSKPRPSRKAAAFCVCLWMVYCSTTYCSLETSMVGIYCKNLKVVQAVDAINFNITQSPTYN
ncbi:hypothetical protein K438DRAFT_1774909 [Mycena galopus ATCC 62051]|nr:hypothetical protein K438DRAFT_1774909 [Mycena galopus ATCC 62051]